MFYNYKLLCEAKKGKFSVIWLIGNHRNLNQQRILSVNIVHSCKEIIETVKSSSRNQNERFSLYLSSILLYGLCIIKKRQCEILYEQMTRWYTQQLFSMPPLKEWSTIQDATESEKRRGRPRKREFEEGEVQIEQVLHAPKRPIIESAVYHTSPPQKQAQIITTEAPPDATPTEPFKTTQERSMLITSFVIQEDDEIMQNLSKIFDVQQETGGEQMLPRIEDPLPNQQTSADAMGAVTQDLLPKARETLTDLDILRQRDSSTSKISEEQKLSFGNLNVPENLPSMLLPLQPEPIPEIPELVVEMPSEIHEERILIQPPEHFPARKKMKRHHVIRDKKTELLFTHIGVKSFIETKFVEDILMSCVPLKEPLESIVPLRHVTQKDLLARGSSDTPEKYSTLLGRRTSDRISAEKISGEEAKSILQPAELYPISEEVPPLQEPESLHVRPEELPETLGPEAIPAADEVQANERLKQATEVPEERKESIQILEEEAESIQAHQERAESIQVQQEKIYGMQMQDIVQEQETVQRPEEDLNYIQQQLLVPGLLEEIGSFEDLCPTSMAKSTAARVFLQLMVLDYRGNITLDQNNSVDFAQIYIICIAA